MNKNKGFTLIEMMVVIAIIGFLSAAILIAVQSARQKSRETAIISKVQELAGIAESYYNPATGVYDSATGDPQWNPIATSIEKMSAKTLKYKQGQNAFKISIELAGTTRFYCVDASGAASIISTQTDDTKCP